MVNILGVRVASITVAELHMLLLQLIENRSHDMVLNVNVHALNIAYEQPWFRRFLNSSKLTVCDGSGVVLAAKLLGRHISRRITYADWTWQLAEFCSEKGFSLYFLGARPEVAQEAANRLLKKYPKLIIAGIHHGYFDKTKGSIENETVIAGINRTKPNILLVGFGMPVQEQWLSDNWSTIDANVALTGGAVFDYVSGQTKRAPRWMTDHGQEWFGRLLIEPRRLWRRYLIGNPVFFYHVFLQLTGLKKFPLD